MPWEWHIDRRGHRHYRRVPVTLGLPPAVEEDQLDPASLKKDALVQYAIGLGIADTSGTKADILARIEALDD